MKTLRERVEWLISEYYPGGARALSARTGVSEPTLSRILAGKAKHPNTDVLQRLARRHNTTVDWFLTGEGPRPQILPDPPKEFANAPGAHGAFAAWLELLDSLPDLRPDARHLAEQLPFAPLLLVAGVSIEPAKLEQQSKVDAFHAARDEFIVRLASKTAEEWITFARAVAAAGGGEKSVSITFNAATAFWSLFDPGFVEFLMTAGRLGRDYTALYQQYVASLPEIRRLRAEREPAEAKPEASPPLVRRAAKKRKR